MTVIDQLSAELAAGRTLGEIVTAAIDMGQASESRLPKRATATVANLLNEPGPVTVAYTSPSPATSPLARAVNVIVDDGLQVGGLITVSMENAAAETAVGDVAPESTIVYDVADELVDTVHIAHWIPVTGHALKRNAALRADVDMFLRNGLLGKIDLHIAAALAAATGTVPHAFDTSLVKTIRTAIAAAQEAFPELGVDEVTVALSPVDHAALDLTGHDLDSWPANIVSTPAIPAGVAYVSRMALAVQLFVTVITVTTGTVNDQFAKNEVTLLAALDAYAHVAAPSALVVADLTS